jgi:hypothetical protein
LQPGVGDFLAPIQMERGQLLAILRDMSQPGVGDGPTPKQIQRGQLLVMLREALQPVAGDFHAFTQIESGHVRAAHQQVRQTNIGKVVMLIEEDRVGPTFGLIPKKKAVGEIGPEFLSAKIQDGAVTVQYEGPTRGLAVVFG